jgi:uncharacterized membrane protein YcaP (DUF421 family)
MMSLDLGRLFAFSVSPLELIVRGSAVYWFLFLIFRVILRRNVGSIAIADVLVLVVIADAAQNAMAGSYESVSDGFVLVGTIVLWNVGLDFAAYRFAPLRRLLEPRPLPLVRNGRLLRHNLRREFLTEDEVTAQLREKGIENLAQVKQACMESDGNISVIKNEA